MTMNYFFPGFVSLILGVCVLKIAFSEWLNLDKKLEGEAGVDGKPLVFGSLEWLGRRIDMKKLFRERLCVGFALIAVTYGCFFVDLRLIESTNTDKILHGLALVVAIIIIFYQKRKQQSSVLNLT